MGKVVRLEDMQRKLQEEVSNVLPEYHKSVVKKFITDLDGSVQMRIRNDAGQSQQLKMLKDNITFLITDLKNKLGIS